ncbi:MFS transporter, UMF1 family [Corynebacterium otitidis]
MSTTAPSPGTDSPPPRAPRAGRGLVAAWAFYDWGSAAFNAAIVTFVFSVYLTDTVGSELSSPSAATWLSISVAISGLIIALTAPVMGQRADQPGRRSRQVAVWTALTVACMAAMALVGDDTAYFWLGLVLLAAGSIAFEFAEIGYFSMLPGIATPQTVGRVSGLGWGMGYVGGIVVLGIAFVGFLAPAAEPGRHGILNLPAEGGLNVRAFCLLAAAWFLLFALPLLVAARRRERRLAPNEPQRRLGVRASYAALFREIKALWRGDRRTALFFLAAAVYRDGLAGVFGFGAVLAATVYGLSPSEIILFGIAGNVAAAAGAFAAGVLDDRFGPKPVICASLALMVLDGLALFFVEGPAGFWALGLALCLLVGPAQSASRTFLVRVTPKGRGPVHRAVRDLRAGGVLPRAGRVRAVHRDRRRRPLRDPRDRARARRGARGARAARPAGALPLAVVF